MNWNQPAPGMVKWHKSRYAQFMRKHQWFFKSKRSISGAACPYLILLIFFPAAASVASGNKSLATIVVPLSLLHLLIYTLLTMAAFARFDHESG